MSGNKEHTPTPQQPEISNAKIYTFMLGMLISGSINTIANKFQQNIESVGRLYSHPWFITTCMFIGESTCLIWYTVYRIQQKKKEKVFLHEDQVPLVISNKKPEIPVYYIAIPALCDFFGSTLMCLGLAMMAGSVYQMLRGSLILFTSLFSVIFLKRILYRHNFLGIGLVVIGLVLVGCGALLDNDPKKKGAETKFLGVVLVLIAQIFSATMFIVEEKLMSVYSCHPLKLVGFEGLWGVFIYSILMIIFYFTPCPFGEDLRDTICVLKENGVDYVIEDITFAFKQLGNNGLLLFFAILYTLSISLFNFVGISITKFVSSAARAVVDSVRTIIVWVFFLTMPFVPEKTKETFRVLQFIGFLFLISGTVVFNEIIEIPWLGLNEYTKRALKAKAERDGLIVPVSDEETSVPSKDETLDTIEGGSKLNKTENKV